VLHAAVVVLPLAAVVAYVVRHVDALSLAGRAMARADPAWLILAGVCALATFPVAAATLQIAANRALPWARTIEVELAGTFLNRITPNGLGRAVLSGRFLAARGLRSDASAAAVAATVAAGFVIHTSGIIITTGLGGARGLHYRLAVAPALLLLAGAVSAVVVTGLIYRRSHRVYQVRTWICAVTRQLRAVARDPQRAAGILIGTAAGSIATLIAFWAALNAIIPSAFLPAATIYLIGTAISNVAPSPAGVGVTEAALTAGLTTIGTPVPQAIAGVLLFRLVSFWLPTVLGAVAWLRICRRNARPTQPTRLATPSLAT
jgi:undecaprenyl-diphosphatase